MSLRGKTILITGATRRVGRALALSVARAGANVIIHHANSPVEAQQVAEEIQQAGGQAWVIQADFHFPEQVEGLVTRVNGLSKLYAIVNNASIFDPLEWKDTSLDDWQRHMNINLTAPFLLSRDFAAQLAPGEKGRIVNILDWRALRPAGDHLPYTISKSALAALTYSMAAALAPNVTVNGLALGAILPPSGSKADDFWLGETPIHRWGKLEEVGESLLFLLEGPEYITGEIIYVDGGRHLV